MNVRLISLILLLSSVSVKAQEQAREINQEFRAAWITSVSNLDWPRPEDRNDIAAQKESLRNYLDTLSALNLNAALLQVRTECDALYRSVYEPWSRYLTGSQGADPGYDPLLFAITEAHKRGIELHAWLNPYRVNASKNVTNEYFDDEHVFIENPEWVLTYNDGGRILNPGLPQVQRYIKKVVGDIINNYDVDGIHFDDYFYSYSGTPTNLDAEAYQEYGSEYSNVGDFRRGSINAMIAQVWDTIQSVKPFVRFGVSPFAIYGNGQNPEGIVGLDAYNVIYCDPLAWLEQGTVDYLTPQLYWPTGGNQDYLKLLEWWANKANQYNRQVFAGHGIYRLPNSSTPARYNNTDSLHELKQYINLSKKNARELADPWTPQQITRQVNINRANAGKGVQGSIYFRMFDFYRVDDLSPELKNEVYQKLARYPVMEWKNPSTPPVPQNLRLEKLEGNAFYSLKWDATQDMRYVIYTYKDTSAAPLANSNNREVITYKDNHRLNQIQLDKGEKIAVASLNRYGVESELSEGFIPDTPGVVTLLTQNNKLNTRSNDSLKWSSTDFVAEYVLEVSTDDSFTSNVAQYVVQDTTQFLSEINIPGEQTYYWRVTARNSGGEGPVSSVNTFTTAFPAPVNVLSPEDQAEKVALKPQIKWQASEATDSIQIQMSEGGNSFNVNNLILDSLVENNEERVFQFNSNLRTLYTHYFRLKGFNEFGASEWTETSQFKTLFPVPPSPDLITLSGQEIELPFSIAWQPLDEATSYLVQVSSSEDFSDTLVEKNVYGSSAFVIDNLTEGITYYARIAGRNVGGIGPFSAGFTFTVVDPVLGLTDDNNAESIIYPNPASGQVFIKGTHSGAVFLLYNAIGKKIPVKVEHFSGKVKLNIGRVNCNPCLLIINRGETTSMHRIITR